MSALFLDLLPGVIQTWILYSLPLFGGWAMILAIRVMKHLEGG